MAASYPFSIKSFLTYQDQPGDSNHVIQDPNNPGSTVDLTIDRAKITNEIHDEVIALEQAIGITGPQFTVIPGSTTMGSEINALFTGKASGHVDPSNNAIYPGGDAHNHVHDQLSGLDQDVHPQYMRVDGSRGFSAPVTSPNGAGLAYLATLGQSQGPGYLTFPQVQFITWTTVKRLIPFQMAGSTYVPPQRWRMTGGYFNGPTDANGIIYLDYSAAQFAGIVTLVYMKMPFPGRSAYGYTYQYEEDQLLLMSISNQGARIQFIEDIVVDRQANVAMSWLVVGV